MSIRPLPDDVVAQIKSSTAIVSLTGVVLELLKNSLDAKASKIDVAVDFSRGGCTVEDDGLGVPPAEFAEAGGLGKLYCTSKYLSDDPHLGQHGTFLASLAAMSLLTLTSHHHAYRSHNSITIHHSHTIERQIPTSAPNHIQHKHGTRVTVRNLFGNMPVRVKQRSIVMDQKTERHRLCEALKKETVALALAWGGAISLRIHDEESTTVVNLNTLKSAANVRSQSTSARRPRSPHLASLLNVLTQANYISIDNWASWVPASASTDAWSVKGAISLEPSPTKHVQFISFGLRSLSSERGYNELYDQVNRLFAQSSFGTINDDAGIDEQEQLRRQSDRRFKSHGYTNRQLKSRKGVDKYPMFQLRISLKDGRASGLVEDHVNEDETNLQAVTDILGAMITQWLSIHHFCPSKIPQAPPQQRIRPTTARNMENRSRSPDKERGSQLRTPAVYPVGTPDSESRRDVAKTGRSGTVPLELSSEKMRSQPFAEWSRIKSGKSSFFEKTYAVNQIQRNPDYTDFLSSRRTDDSIQLPPIKADTQDAIFYTPPLRKGALAPKSTMHSLPRNDDTSVADHRDASVPWTDPMTQKTYHLNARTGCMMPSREPRSRSDPAHSTNTAKRACTRRNLDVVSDPATASASRTPWLDGLLQTWNNPVFKPGEKLIPQATQQDWLGQGEQLHASNVYTQFSYFDIFQNPGDAKLIPARLSKDGLRGAKVISQVDQKFILVQMIGTSTTSKASPVAESLVLVDQHAADERIRVEKLLADLCSPVKVDVQKIYRSGLGLRSNVDFVTLDKPLQFAISPQEHEYFRLYAASFAEWGILYNLDGFVYTACTDAKNMPRLTVTTLPPGISERCKADAQLLIALLRSTLWQYVDSSLLQSAASSDQRTSWVNRIATCPPGLVDMINSRACRSAIMFNDVLSQQECSRLVSNLADCIFPFMCAHGRPSMVPIVDLEGLELSRQDTGCQASDGTIKDTPFVDAWKRWNK